MDDCIFCKIASGNIPSAKVFEDSQFIAFLDISPANKGHTLLITKGHYRTLGDIPPEILSEMSAKVQSVALRLKEYLFADGYNILMNNGADAGQVVNHAHIHIIPRFSGDSLRLNWKHQAYQEGEMEELAKRITGNGRD
jgi:histidine triad (HIT) family protein